MVRFTHLNLRSNYNDANMNEEPMGTTTMHYKTTLYPLSSAGSSLTDFDNLPDVKTPDPFTAKTVIQNKHSWRGKSLSAFGARLASPWDFRLRALSEWGSQDDKSSVIPATLAEPGGKSPLNSEMVIPPPFMGVAYETGKSDKVVVVDKSIQERVRGLDRKDAAAAEKQPAKVEGKGEGVRIIPRAIVGHPWNVDGRLSEEMVMRALILTGRVHV